jgi:hypothetical protein
MSKKSSTITVYFGLSKGEGSWPDLKILSRKESEDPRSFCTFQLCPDDELESGIDISHIKQCTVLYDGILPLQLDNSTQLGLKVENKQLTGRIRPVIRFELTRSTDPDAFRRFIWGSSYRLQPKKATEAFFAEDWNGYTEVLSPAREKEWIKALHRNNVYSGKTFSPKQLMAGVTATRMEPQEHGGFKEMTTPIFQQQLEKARRLVKKYPKKFNIKGKRSPVLVLQESSRRGTWSVCVTSSPQLCPEPFLVALFLPKNQKMPSGYSIALVKP